MLPQLPMSTAEEVNRLDHMLLDATFNEQMVLELKTHDRPATSTAIKVRRLMDKLMNANLTLLYTWTGKSAIYSTSTMRLSFNYKHGIASLMVKVLQYKNMSPFDEKEILAAMQSYFKRAKERTENENKKRPCPE